MKERTKDHPHHFGKLKNDVRDRQLANFAFPVRT